MELLFARYPDSFSWIQYYSKRLGNGFELEFFSHLDPWSYSIDDVETSVWNPDRCKSCGSGLTLYLANVWKLDNHVLYALLWQKQTQSSANRRINDLISFMMSLIYKQNNKGPRTVVPWGTPDKTNAYSDFGPWQLPSASYYTRMNQPKEPYCPLCHIRASCISEVHVQVCLMPTRTPI